MNADCLGTGKSCLSLFFSWEGSRHPGEEHECMRSWKTRSSHCPTQAKFGLEWTTRLLTWNLLAADFAEERRLFGDGEVVPAPFFLSAARDRSTGAEALFPLAPDAALKGRSSTVVLAAVAW